MTFSELQELISLGQDEFRGVEFTEDVWLNRHSVEVGESAINLIFDSCNFKSIHIELSDSDCVEGITFRNSEISSNIYIFNTRSQILTFSECIIKAKLLSIKDCGKDFSFSLFNTDLKQVIIKGCQNCNDLLFESSQIQKLEITNSSFYNILVSNPKSLIDDFFVQDIQVNKLEFHEGIFGWLKLDDSEIENLILYRISNEEDNFLTTSLRLRNLIGKNLKISEVSFNLLVQIDNISFSNAKFLQESKFTGTLEFNNQDLNGFRIYSIDLFNAQLNFENTILYEAHFFDIIWPKGFLLYPDYKSLEQNQKWDFMLRSLSDQYRQLKIMSAKNGDKIVSLNFYTHEMEVNQIMLKRQKKTKLWDWLLLYTNKHFSNFGLSYVNPLKWLVLIHSVMFFLFVLSGYKELVFIWPWNNSITGISESLGHFFYLLNPLHKLPEDEGGLILVVDFFSRIFNSYFIYYFIKATRKFTS